MNVAGGNAVTDVTLRQVIDSSARAGAYYGERVTCVTRWTGAGPVAHI
jgi:hypothetical protein